MSSLPSVLLLLAGLTAVWARFVDFRPCELVQPCILECRTGPVREVLEAFERNRAYEGIRELRLTIHNGHSEGWTDQVVDKILEWMAKGSRGSLTRLVISNTKITQTPFNINLYPNLNVICMNNHNWNVLPAIFFDRRIEEYTKRLSLIDIRNNRIKEIDSQAFQGKTFNITIDLN